jgi:hypothetical protein
MVVEICYGIFKKQCKYFTASGSGALAVAAILHNELMMQYPAVFAGIET